MGDPDSCSDYFSVWDLGGFSRETEVAQSTHCLPNRAKFGLLVFSVALNGIFMGTLLGLLTKEWRRRVMQARSCGVNS